MKKLLALLVIIIIPSIASAQCKSFVKKHCAPTLENYIPSDKFNSLKMFEGEEAEMNLVFTAHHDYRVTICSQEIIGDVYYEVKTESGQTIFTSDEGKSFFDFSTTSTQVLQVVISVPEGDNPNGIPQAGCVTVMIGSLASS